MAATSLILVNKATICSEVPADLPIILVKSSISHQAERNVIRNTWADYALRKHQIRTLFVLGSSQDVYAMKDILNEELEHRDLLLSFAQDDYYNLTLKTIFTLFWVSVYCDDHWALYVDDDSLVNPDKLVKHVTGTKRTASIHCSVLKHKPVIRNQGSKWFMPKSIWNETHYPDYCLGVGFLLPPRLAGRLHASSVSNDTQPKLWIDDVFVTGIASAAANIPLMNPGLFSCCGSASVTRFRYQNMLLFGEIKPAAELQRVWQNVTEIIPQQETRTRFFPQSHPHSQSRLSHSLLYLMLIFAVIGTVFVAKYGYNSTHSVAYRPLQTDSKGLDSL